MHASLSNEILQRRILLNFFFRHTFSYCYICLLLTGIWFNIWDCERAHCIECTVTTHFLQEVFMRYYHFTKIINRNCNRNCLKHKERWNGKYSKRWPTRIGQYHDCFSNQKDCFNGSTNSANTQSLNNLENKNQNLVDYFCCVLTKNMIRGVSFLDPAMDMKMDSNLRVINEKSTQRNNLLSCSWESLKVYLSANKTVIQHRT